MLQSVGRTESGEGMNETTQVRGALPIELLPGIGHYQGQKKNGRRHGEGLQTWECGRFIGSVYEGEWRDDQAHGRGRLAVMPSGLVATGLWRMGRLHGCDCRVAMPDGSVFTGVFREGLPSGSDCSWIRSTSHFSKGTYNQGRAMSGLVNDTDAWEATDKDITWDWSTMMDLGDLLTDENVHTTLNESEWVAHRTEELRGLWQASPEMVLQLADRYGCVLGEDEPFAVDNLVALASKMWECTPSGHLFCNSRTIASNDARHRATMRSKIKRAGEDFLALVEQEDMQLHDKSSRGKMRSETEKSLAESQHPKFLAEVLVGRVERIPADSDTKADLHLDLTKPPCKPGDMEYVVRKPCREPCMIKTLHRDKLVREYVDRYCGHTFRPIKPRVDASLENILGRQYDDDELLYRLSDYRKHGGEKGKGCPQTISVGVLHDLSDGCTHLSSYAQDKEFDSILQSCHRLNHVDYELEPKSAQILSEGEDGASEPDRKWKLRYNPVRDDSELLRVPSQRKEHVVSAERSTSPRNISVSPSQMHNAPAMESRTSKSGIDVFDGTDPSSRPGTSSTLGTTDTVQSNPAWITEGLILPGKIKKGMVAEDSESFRVAALRPVQKYLQDLTSDKGTTKTDLMLSPMGQMSYQGNTKPTVMWKDVHRAVGFSNECLRAAHEYSSHELKALPYSSGLITMPPAKPSRIQSGDQLIQTLGLREDNLHILLKVKSLNISGHCVQALPARIEMLKNLNELDASSNQLKMLPSEIQSLADLRRLNLDQNPGLMRDVPHSIMRLTALVQLHLKNTGLLRLSQSISVLRKLALLDISDNEVMSLPRKQLSDMKTLVTLHCQGNPEIEDRVCGIPKEVVNRPGVTTLSRDGDKHPTIPLSDSWNWTPDGVLGFLRHRPHMFVPIRKEEGQPQTGGWMRSSTAVVCDIGGPHGVSDRATQLIDELLRLVIFLRKYPFPSPPGGPELTYKEVELDPLIVSPENSKLGKKGKKKKGKSKKKRVGIEVERYYVADRIHDIWMTFQRDYAHLTKNKPGEECVFFKHLVSAINNTTLLSTNFADVQRLLKTYKKKTAKDGFPFPRSYLQGFDSRERAPFPGKRVNSTSTASTPLKTGRLAPLFVATNEHRTEHSGSTSKGEIPGEIAKGNNGAEQRQQLQQDHEEGGGQGEAEGEEDESEEGVEEAEEEEAAAEEEEEGEEGEEEEDEEQAKLLAKVKKFNVWEFHGVMFLVLMELRMNGHIKGAASAGGSKKGSKKKKK